MEDIRQELESQNEESNKKGYAPTRRPLRKYKGNLVRLDLSTGEYKYV